MMPSLYLALEAHNPARGAHRRYEVDVAEDLFGELMVVISFGRAGAKLRQMRFGGLSEAEAIRLVRSRLRRRLSAPRRAGCSYYLCQESVMTAAERRRWVPCEIAAVACDTMLLRGISLRE
ncbi:MAG: WGR domain-containing protein [Planctomycetes bacterium]|nr:WGR domain-containing protein [Planctomycetota bacterium]